MGLEDAPEDGKAVAASIFLAVAVYGVCLSIVSKVVSLTVQ